MPSCTGLRSFCAARVAFVFVAILASAGCPGPSPRSTGPGASNPTPSSASLKLLVVDDAPLAEAIARQWKSRTEQTLDVQPVGLGELLKASRLPGDVVIFPTGLVGHLVERELIVPLDDRALATSEFDRRDIFDQVRLRDIAWGNRTVAVPLGSPQLMLVYRRDLLEKLSLAPPRTWKEYQQALERLNADAPSSEQPVAPTVEPLAAGWAGNLLLARAAAYAAHRDQVSFLMDYSTLEPLITAPPYVRALEELVAAHQSLPAGSPLAKQRPAPADALEELYAGRAAMAITWPATIRASDEPCKLPLGFALLPGASEAYNFATGMWEPRGEAEEVHVPLLGVSGRLAAVTSTAANAREAQSFAAWLGSREISPLVAPASRETTLFRQSHVADAGRWTSGLDAATARSYADTLQQSTSLQRFLALRLPGREEYLAALDAAVAAAIGGEQTPPDALASASEKWKEITATRGAAAQRRALRRGLGLESLP